MKPHYSEADLLETYYTRPGESMPVMMHLAGCSECAARYERLESKMQSLRSCHRHEKADTFWIRQRMSIMRRIGQGRERRASFARITRVAAAAMIVLVLGTMALWDRVAEPSSRQVVDRTTAPATPLVDDPTTRRLEDSPWSSDELDEYSSIVAWESWVEEGDHSS